MTWHIIELNGKEASCCLLPVPIFSCPHVILLLNTFHYGVGNKMAPKQIFIRGIRKFLTIL